MKIVFPFWKSYPFMIDDQDRRHNLRFWIRWFCCIVAFYSSYKLTPMIYEAHSIFEYILEAIIYMLICYIILLICSSIVYLIAIAGCTKMFKTDEFASNDPI